tara:strand:+ start:6128 stop:6985 length:858 start_codon:yes stop_codon:yes gene_type:complete
MIRTRTIGNLFYETFSIFTKCLYSFGVIAICVFGPLSLISILGPSQESLQTSLNQAQTASEMLAYLFSGYGLYTIGLSILTIFAITVGFSALSIAAVQYINDKEINLETCLKQVSWRLLSIILMTGILIISIITTMFGFLLFIPTIGLLAAFGIGVFFLTLISLLVTVHEGEKYFAAIKRGFKLVENTLLRVAGTMILITIIGVFTKIILDLLFTKIILDLPKLFIISSVNNEIILYKILFEAVGLISISTSVTIMSISVTLMYLDMRIRFEEFDDNKLSNQTRI